MSGGPGQKPGTEQLVAQASRVRLLALDVDGVLTDGGLYYGPEGEALKRFDVKDGHGLVLARTAGLTVAWLTARTSAAVAARAKDLKIQHLYQGQRDKLTTLKTLLEELSLEPSECAFMGDDLVDLACLRHVGLPCCPADAVQEIRQTAHYVAQNRGGSGAVRELVELCLKASGRWDTVVGAAH